MKELEKIFAKLLIDILSKEESLKMEYMNKMLIDILPIV
jgi:hypothetical protein